MLRRAERRYRHRRSNLIGYHLNRDGAFGEYLFFTGIRSNGNGGTVVLGHEPLVDCSRTCRNSNSHDAGLLRFMILLPLGLLSLILFTVCLLVLVVHGTNAVIIPKFGESRYDVTA